MSVCGFRAPCRQHRPQPVSSLDFSQPIHLKVSMLLQTALLGACSWCPSILDKALGIFTFHLRGSIFYFCMGFRSLNTHIQTDLMSSASSPPG